MDISKLTITSFQKGLREKKFSALEIARAVFENIEERDGDIGAYLRILKDDAYAQAEAVDIRIAEHREVPPLGGVPLAIKDNIFIAGGVVTAASKMLEHYTASYDATVITKLKEHGAVFLGKTNLDEFAMGASTENSAFQVTRNPHDTDYVPGGSSGGSAAAVAADEALAALGSDTGGSVRQPAALCGVVGLRPTYGAVSRHGLAAMASSLDQIGPITKTVDDARILFGAICGEDIYDATSTNSSLEAFDLERTRNMTVGIPDEYFVEGLDERVARGIETVRESLERSGVSVRRISLPHTKYALACYYIIVPAEVSTNLARLDGIRYGRTVKKPKSLNDLYVRERGGRFGTEVKRRILLGTFVLSSGYYDAYYTQAQRVRRLITQDFEEAFKDVDVILTPTAPTPAFKIGEKINDPLSMYLFDIYTVPSSLAGLPGISIPVRSASEEELPIGFQLIGKRFRESDIFDLGSLYEQTTVSQ